MKNIDPNNAKQMGNMGLHILGINDMPSEKWLSWFEDEHTKKVALADEQGYIARLPANLQERARDLLTNGVGDQAIATANNCDVDPNVRVRHSNGFIKLATPDTTKAPVTLSVKSSVVTDKGVYHSVENLKERLSGVYSIDGFDKVWIEALTLSKVDLDVEYISNNTKKLLISNIKSAIILAVGDTISKI